MISQGNKGRSDVAAPAMATFLAVGAAFRATLAIGETISFQADGGVKTVRAYDQFGMAVIESIGAPGAIYQCVALDQTGQPIETVSALSDMGQMMIEGLSADAIGSVKCRKVM